MASGFSRRGTCSPAIGLSNGHEGKGANVTTTASDIEAFKQGVPGTYLNIPARDYHALDACSASRLKDMRRSVAHCRWSMDNGKSSPSMVVGSALHAMRLEPETFNAIYCRAELCSASTAKGGRCSNSGSIRSGGDW